MDLNLKLAKVFAVAAMVLVVFVSLYVFHGASYLVRAALGAEPVKARQRPRLLPRRRLKSVHSETADNPEKAAA